MGKNPAYLPGCAWTVGGMIDAQLHVTWGCAKCRRSGTVSLQQVAQARGIDYCMVDRRSTCREPGCGGDVRFRYSGGPGTPSRPLEALRERQVAAEIAEADRAMAAARHAYNAIARRYRRQLLP